MDVLELLIGDLLSEIGSPSSPGINPGAFVASTA